MKDTECRANGTNKKIKFNILADEEMRKIGFTDYSDKFWYYCKMINSEFCISFEVTIPKNKSDDRFRIDVIDESFGQPYDYQSILKKNPNFEFAKMVKVSVEKQMKYLQDNKVLEGHVIGEYI